MEEFLTFIKGVPIKVRAKGAMEALEKAKKIYKDMNKEDS